MKQFVGDYTSPEFDGQIKLFMEGSKLMVFFRNEKSEATMSTADKLSLGLMSATANRDSGGVIRCLTIDMGRANGMKMYKS